MGKAPKGRAHAVLSSSPTRGHAASQPPGLAFGEPEDILADPEVAGIEPVYLEVPPGSVAYHHGLTVHLANANTTDADRAVHTVIYFPDGHHRGYPFGHFAVDRGGIEVGQPIDSDVTPIAWPRPDGSLPAEQVSALAMAIYLNSMSFEEAARLTTAMAASGTVLEWSGQDLDGPLVDKHSTGGVGDKVSFLLAPIAAACGCFVPTSSMRQ